MNIYIVNYSKSTTPKIFFTIFQKNYHKKELPMITQNSSSQFYEANHLSKLVISLATTKRS